MKKLTLVFMALLFVLNISFAQKGRRDIIYLKNGSVINGQIISSLPSGQMKIKTRDNSLWIFEPSEIDSISKTNNLLGQIRTGYFNLTEAAILTGNSDNRHNAPFSFINISGWQFTNRFSVGAGTGVEFFSETYLPVVADFRYYLNHQEANPFFGLQGGYSIALDKPDKQYMYQTYNLWQGTSGNALDIKARGGFLLNPSVGICTPINENLMLTVSAGYRMMRHRYVREDDYKIDIDYNRLSLKIGLLFQ